MTAGESKEPKERILSAALSLFAQRGFAAVGVREIASAAEVNLAMISYYFEGKTGILKAVIENFFDQYSQIFFHVDDERKSPEECMRILVGKIVDFVRNNTELSLVVYNEIPLDVPELNELKAERISQLIRHMSGLIRRFGLDPGDRTLLGMIGPSLITMIFTNFRLRPVLRHVFKARFDDAYYERLTETISTLFLNGIHGIVAQKQRPMKG